MLTNLSMLILTFIQTQPLTRRNDGDEPEYMELDPTSWLSSTVDSCCQKFFGGFNYDVCMGRYPPDHDDCNVMLFYPDWEGANEGCTNDGKQSQSYNYHARYLRRGVHACLYFQ